MAASAEDPNAWEYTKNHMAHDVEHAVNGEDQICSTFTISKVKLKSLIQLEVKSAVQATRREDMKGLVEEIIGNVFKTGY